MDSSSSRHGSHKQYGVKSEECEVQSLMRNHRGQFNDLFNTQQKIEQAFLGLRKELDLYRQKVQQLEAEKAEYQLEQLRPVTIFDVTDEFISHELNTFHRSLDSWAHALPEIQNPSFRARVLPSDSISPHQHLSQRGGPNSGLALSYEDQKHLEPELVAAALSRIMLDMMFSQRLFGIPQNDRRIFTNLLNTIPRMKAGEGMAYFDEIDESRSVV